MKITFLYGGFESLGIEQLSSVLKFHGHQVSLVFDSMIFNDGISSSSILSRIFSYKEEVVDEVIKSEPDLVAFSVVTPTYQWALGLAKEIKKRINVPIIFGGVHPTLVPERVMQNQCIDMVCLGEGEYPLLELVNSIENRISNHNIENIWFKSKDTMKKNPIRPLIDNLDSLPFLDKDLFYEKTPAFRKIYFITSSRGCPYDCTFCCNHTLRKISCKNGKWVRRKGVNNVIRELKLAKKKYNIPLVFFLDDVFTMDEKWLGEFAKSYKREVNLPFKCISHPQSISPKVINHLKYAGCVDILLGLQSANEKTRRKVLNRRETNKQISEVCKLIKQAGIDFSIDHIFDIPFEGAKEQIEAANFYNELRPTRIYVYGLSYFPKTEITNIAKEAKLIDDAIIHCIEEGLGESLSLGGNVKKKEGLFERFSIFFSILPLLPEKIINFLINKKLYRLLPPSSRLFKYIRIFDLLFRKDIFAKTRFIYYKSFMMKWIKLRWAKKSFIRLS